MLELSFKFVWYVMRTTMTQAAMCFVRRLTTPSATTPAVLTAKKFAIPDGMASIVTSRFVPKDVWMERVSFQVSVNAATDIKAQDATSAKYIQDARMASVKSHGIVYATKTGVEFFVTKVSIEANSSYRSLIFFICVNRI